MKSLSEIRKETVQKTALIQLVGCSVVNIEEDDISEEGCETCDYGSKYGIEYTFHFSDNTSHYFDISQMYDSPISKGEMMSFILNNLEAFSNMTKDEFIKTVGDSEKVLGEDGGCF